MLATFYLVLVYVVLTPVLGGLLAWVLDRLINNPRPRYFDLGADPGFWLMLAFILGAPVLTLACLVHFLARRKPALTAFAIVMLVAEIGWAVIPLVLDAQRILPFMMAGFVAICFAFPLAHRVYMQTAFGALPPARESAKPAQ